MIKYILKIYKNNYIIKIAVYVDTSLSINYQIYKNINKEEGQWLYLT
jgi:predicted metal-dependent peptidase